MKKVEKAKVLFVTHYTELYGANRSLLNLVEGLTSYHPIVLVPRRGDITDKLDERGIEYIVQNFYSECYIEGAFLPQLKGLFKWILNVIYSLLLSVKLKRKKIDFIHSNSSVVFIGAYIAFFLRRAHIWHIREFAYEDYRYKYCFGSGYFRLWLRRCSLVICISNAIKESRIPKKISLPTLVIPNGVMSKNNFKKRELERSSVEAFGIIGFLSTTKNQIEAIEAFSLYKKHHPKAVLYIIGEGYPDYVRHLKQEASRLDVIDSVIFTGFQEDVSKYYRLIDILLMTSKNEGLGRVSLEAMAFGIPVIGYDNAGTSEVIIDGETGLLYRGGAEELSEKMRVLSDNREQYKALMQRSQAVFIQQYTIETYVARIESSYRSVFGVQTRAK